MLGIAASNSIVAIQLKKAINQKGLKQASVATKAGYSAQELNDMLNGTDNRYLQNGYQSLPAWKENGWTRTGNQGLRNADLWRQVDKLFGGHAVRFKIEKMDE